jgi:hypothetical protein
LLSFSRCSLWAGKREHAPRPHHRVVALNLQTSEQLRIESIDRPFVSGRSSPSNPGLSPGRVRVKPNSWDSAVECVSAARQERELLDRIRDVMRLEHYNLRTERTYCDWVERFIGFM